MFHAYRPTLIYLCVPLNKHSSIYILTTVRIIPISTRGQNKYSQSSSGFSNSITFNWFLKETFFLVSWIDSNRFIFLGNTDDNLTTPTHSLEFQGEPIPAIPADMGPLPNAKFLSCSPA